MQIIITHHHHHHHHSFHRQVTHSSLQWHPTPKASMPRAPRATRLLQATSLARHPSPLKRPNRSSSRSSGTLTRRLSASAPRCGEERGARAHRARVHDVHDVVMHAHTLRSRMHCTCAEHKQLWRRQHRRQHGLPHAARGRESAVRHSRRALAVPDDAVRPGRRHDEDAAAR